MIEEKKFERWKELERKDFLHRYEDKVKLTDVEWNELLILRDELGICKGSQILRKNYDPDFEDRKFQEFCDKNKKIWEEYLRC